MPAPRRKSPAGKTFRGVTPVTKALTDEEKALIWQLTEEGLSQREIGEKLGIGRNSVTRTLASDPVGLEQVRTVLREARAAKWKQCEAIGITEALEWQKMLAVARASLQTALAMTNRKLRIAKLSEIYDLLHVIPRVIQATRAAAGESAKQVQLLTGGITERIGTAVNDEDLGPEQLCQRAISLGREADLPPRLRAYAEALRSRQGGLP